jgi:hypothetical protein
MKTVSSLVPVTIAAGLFGAMVLASPIEQSATGTPAITMDRSAVFADAGCAAKPVAQKSNWHDALAAKRVQDRAAVLVADRACAPKDA